jgi:glutathione S-transferase
MTDTKCCSKDAQACQTCVEDTKASFVLQPDGKDIKSECKGKDCPYAKHIKLFYFEGRGRAEIARLMMVAGGLQWVDIRIPQDEWAGKWKPKMPYGQLPCMCARGEAQIAQSRAIEHYIAAYAGLNGRDPLEQAKIDQAVEGCTDLLNPWNKINWEIKDEKEKKTALENFWKNTFTNVVGALEKLLCDKAEYFVGNRLTYADICVYNSLFGLLAADKACLKAYPKLAALVERVSANPKIAAWIKARPQTPW